MKTFFYILFIFGLTLQLRGQNEIWQATVEALDVQLREPKAVVLHELEVNLPSDGKVIVKFEGNIWSSKGDIITLAASNGTEWDSNDGNVGVYVYDSIHVMNNFHHTRIYEVSKGINYFYALGHNWVDKYGNGKATIKGKLMVEFIASENNNTSVLGKRFKIYPVNLTENSKVIDSISFDATTEGKLIVTLDGSSASISNNELALGSSLDGQWHNDAENISTFHNYSDDTKILTYNKVYDLNAGTHLVYILAKKILGNMETSNNAFYLTYNLQFVPNDQEDYIVKQNEIVHQLNRIDTIKTCGSIEFESNREGKALLNFSGYCTSDYEDVVLLSLVNSSNEDSIIMERKVQPIHINDHKTYLSMSAVVDLHIGINSFDINGEFDSSLNGTGVANLFGKLTLKFIPESIPTSSNENESNREGILLFPNPTTGNIKFIAGDEKKVTDLTIYNFAGVKISSVKNISLNSAIINLDNNPDGIYFIKFNHENTMYKIIKVSNN